MKYTNLQSQETWQTSGRTNSTQTEINSLQIYRQQQLERIIVKNPINNSSKEDKNSGINLTRNVQNSWKMQK